MQLCWHRRDLRLSDNATLAATTSRDRPSVLPVFVLDPTILEHSSPIRTTFLLDALEAVRSAYGDLDSTLLVRVGDPKAVLPALAREVGAERVGCHAEHTGLARRRDRRVRSALAAIDVDLETHEDLYVQPPGTISTGNGEPYQRFRYFGEKWANRDSRAPYDTPNPDRLAYAAPDPIPSIEELGSSPPEVEAPPATTTAARRRLDRFCDGPIYDYDRDRDVPARDGTSRLSVHLRFGTIGIRTVLEATQDALDRADADSAREGVREFRRQLAWREFYAHVLADRPNTVTHPHRELDRPIEWREDPSGLAAWKRGTTGYPMVDAGMRELLETGFMHNRSRMVAASFLTKHLLLDWREGYRWFRRRLLDHDTANDVGGWQWAASVGADAQPYFRILNPTTQGERLDPEAEYIRGHVPELRTVEPDAIHEWASLAPSRRADVAPNYPDPIVDHDEARERAIATFERAIRAEA